MAFGSNIKCVEETIVSDMLFLVSNTASGVADEEPAEENDACFLDDLIIMSLRELYMP